MPQTNPKVTNVAIGGSAGAWTVILATILSSKLEVMEDPSIGGAQGLQGYYMDPDAVLSAAFLANPTPGTALAKGYLANPNLQNWLPNPSGAPGQGFEPISFGGSDGRVHGGEGGYVAGQGRALLLIRSLGAAANGILLTEWP